MSGIISTGTVESLRTLKDNTIKLGIALQEMAPDKIGELFSYNGQFIKFYITNENINNDVKEVIDETEIDNEAKSPSKRLRNVFYRLWEVDNKGYTDFQLFYNWMMERVIEHYKDKLP